jgi:hypothetical protein
VLTLGIDVGITGAIACLRDDGAFLDVEDLPVMTYRTAKWIDGTELLTIVRRMRQGSPAKAIVERIHAMPAMGALANNSKGMTLGSTLSILQVAGCAIELVEPGTWKRGLGLLAPKSTDREKKVASLHRARQLFPSAPLSRIADNGRAEALLIAHWHQRKSRPTQLEVA